MTDTEIKIGKFTLKNPITLASGTAGFGEELSAFCDVSKVGALFTKGLSIKPRPGNSGNRILETAAGVLNSIGLENPGLDVFLREKLPFMIKNGIIPVPNIAGHSEEENIELCSVLSSAPGIEAVELNVSCPNVKEGGMAFGTDMGIFTRLLEKIRPACRCALIVKLSPNVTDPAAFAKRAEELGADAVSAVNTFLGMKIDVNKRRPHFDNKVAGLSGPAIKPLALRIVYQICGAVEIPVIGLGGISCINDVLEFLMAGASAVSIGTLNMIHPDSGPRLVRELDEYMNANGISSIKEIIGSARRG